MGKCQYVKYAAWMFYYFCLRFDTVAFLFNWIKTKEEWLYEKGKKIFGCRKNSA